MIMRPAMINLNSSSNSNCKSITKITSTNLTTKESAIYPEYLPIWNPITSGNFSKAIWLKGYICSLKAIGLVKIESKKVATKRSASEKDGSSLQIRGWQRWQVWLWMDKKWLGKKAIFTLKIYGIWSICPNSNGITLLSD